MISRLVSKFPFYQKYLADNLQAESKFYRQNRIKVLDTYRHLLKLIPKIYPRSLQQAQKFNEMKWIFKQSKQLPTIYEVEGRTKLATDLLSQLKKGDYSRLGDLVPQVEGKKYSTINEFLASGTPKKKWWRGHIY